MTAEKQNREPIVVERVQTGVRIEKRMLKVLKAVAELKEIEQFKSLYGMTLQASDSHNLKERRK